MFFNIVLILHSVAEHTPHGCSFPAQPHISPTTHTHRQPVMAVRRDCRCHVGASISPAAAPRPRQTTPRHTTLTLWNILHTVHVVLLHFLPWHTLQCKHICVSSVLYWSTSIKLCCDQTFSWKLVNGIIESAEIWSNRARLLHVQIMYQCHSKQPTNLVSQVGSTCCSWRCLLFTKADSCPNLVPCSSLDLKKMHLNQHMEAILTCTLVLVESLVELTPTQDRIWHETHYLWLYTCKRHIHW